MVITLILLSTLWGGGYLFMNQKQFGAVPSGARLERIKQSPNYKNGTFQNLSPTPVMAEGYSMWKVLKEYVKEVKDQTPTGVVPFVETDLNSLAAGTPSVVWFGHSSYLLTIGGKRYLVDPVFSGSASPFSFAVKSFDGANEYQVGDLPPIDAVIITHDHYDHLDYKTMTQLIPKVSKFYTALGVGAHLNRWGVPDSQIVEFDWWESFSIDSTTLLTATPARHFSGRKFARGNTLWTSFVLQANGMKVFIGGDSGYDTHFKTIGDKFGPFDLVILECGQYNMAWHNIHMLPSETIIAATELKAKVLLPVHNSKFKLALHAWYEPLNEVYDYAQKANLTLTTPLIGEPVFMGQQIPQQKWWELTYANLK